MATAARFTPIEPTHIVLIGQDLDEIRLRVQRTLISNGALEAVPGVYEVWVRNSLVCFSVQYETPSPSNGGSEGEAVVPSWIVEFRKQSGCTLSFLTFFISCLDEFKSLAESEPPELVVDPSSAEICWKWIEDHGAQESRQTLPPLMLSTQRSQLDETLAPVLAMLASPWYESQLEGLTCIADVSETLSNASTLAGYLPVLQSLAQMDILHSNCRHLIRCFARVVANLMTAPWLNVDSACSFLCCTLARRIEQVAHPHRHEPLWKHVGIEVVRIRPRQ